MLYVNSMCIYGRFTHNAPCLCRNKAVLYVDSRRTNGRWLCCRSAVLQLRMLFIGISSIISGLFSVVLALLKLEFTDLRLIFFPHLVWVFISGTKMLYGELILQCLWHAGTAYWIFKLNYLSVNLVLFNCILLNANSFSHGNVILSVTHPACF